MVIIYPGTMRRDFLELGLMRRVALAICWMLLAGAVCGARQSAPVAIPAQHVSATADTTEMDRWLES